jgi:hypothetical protein
MTKLASSLKTGFDISVISKRSKMKFKQRGLLSLTWTFARHLEVLVPEQMLTNVSKFPLSMFTNAVSLLERDSSVVHVTSTLTVIVVCKKRSDIWAK